MNIKLLTKHHLEFLSLKGGCTGSSKSTHVKMPHGWKSHVTAHLTLTHDSKQLSGTFVVIYTLWAIIVPNMKTLRDVGIPRHRQVSNIFDLDL